MRSPCIAVPLKSGEEVRKKLLEKGLLNTNLKLKKDEEILYLPLLIEKVSEDVLGYKILEKNFEELEIGIRSYKEIMDIPDELRDNLPTSFDIIGSLAIIKIPDDLWDYKEKIGWAILDSQKNLRSVAVDFGVEGEERVRKLEVIAGEQSTETFHKEYGIELQIDASKVYFSPRLATERWRVAQEVEEEEIIIDMFCGVGPYSILIAKYKSPRKIYAIDINSEAVDYLKKNIQRNKVGNIIALQGDSKTLLPELEPADRIIMNLPHSAFDFLDIALRNVKHNGTIHYYEVVAHDHMDQRLRRIRELAGEGGSAVTLLKVSRVHTYSPESNMYCFDMKVEKDEGNI